MSVPERGFDPQRDIVGLFHLSVKKDLPVPGNAYIRAVTCKGTGEERE